MRKGRGTLGYLMGRGEVGVYRVVFGCSRVCGDLENFGLGRTGI